jgi:hypothetical protein
VKRSTGAWPDWGPVAARLSVARPEGPNTLEAGLAPNCSSAAAPVSESPFSNGNPRVLPVGEKRNAEESAAIRAQRIPPPKAALRETKRL